MAFAISYVNPIRFPASALHIRRHRSMLCKYLTTETTQLLSDVNSRTSQVTYSRRCLTQTAYNDWFSLNNPPINCAYSYLNSVHDTLGLPWWASIIISTVLLRSIVTLPVFILIGKNTAKLEMLATEVRKIVEDLKLEVAHAKMQYKWSNKIAVHHFRRNLKRHLTILYERDNCHPSKNFILPWLQVPIWVSTSLAIRNMSGTFAEGDALPIKCLDLATEGALWFPNLLLPDPIVLPLLFCTSNLILLELYNLRIKKPNRMQRYLTNILRGMNVVMVPIAASLPSSLTLYWATSSTFGLLQYVVTSLPSVRRAMGIPKTPSESATPLRDTWQNIKEKINRRNGKN